MAKLRVNYTSTAWKANNRRIFALFRKSLAVREMFDALDIEWRNSGVVEMIFSQTVGPEKIRHATIITPDQIIDEDGQVVAESKKSGISPYNLILLTEGYLHYYSLDRGTITHKSCKNSDIMFEATYFFAGDLIERLRIHCVSSEYVGGVYVSLPEAHYIFSGEVGIAGAIAFLEKFAMYRNAKNDKVAEFV